MCHFRRPEDGETDTASENDEEIDTSVALPQQMNHDPSSRPSSVNSVNNEPSGTTYQVR